MEINEHMPQLKRQKRVDKNRKTFVSQRKINYHNFTFTDKVETDNNSNLNNNNNSAMSFQPEEQESCDVTGICSRSASNVNMRMTSSAQPLLNRRKSERTISISQQSTTKTNNQTLKEQIIQHRNEIYPLAVFWDKFNAEIADRHAKSMQSQNIPTQPVGNAQFGTPRDLPIKGRGHLAISDHYRRAFKDTCSTQNGRDEKQRNINRENSKMSLVYSKRSRNPSVADEQLIKELESDGEYESDSEDGSMEFLEMSVKVNKQLRQKVRRAWMLIRRHVLENKIQRAVDKSDFRWKMVQKHTKDIGNTTETRLQLYDRYLQNTHFWIQGFSSLPDTFTHRYSEVLTTDTSRSDPVVTTEHQYGVRKNMSNLERREAVSAYTNKTQFSNRPAWIKYFSSKPKSATPVRPKTHCV